ncbi:hypothetical protein, conserved [Babesia ovata]|uniref:C3H1-type domain-containing protein n=1 Tax=Babesia ovata TaxID=189622 RepID=A0A2H6KJE9_9APIC|nr:uncharacterized protein BOVATA_046180 [Babesia ovata]GBE63125.1 hypothetical protein, conserved [Babesia ovata]
MAFLHSVLKDVHDKQPYETGKGFIDSLVKNTLQPNLHSGHDGFCTAFPKVSVHVERYNKEVKASNEKIKSRIQGLEKDMKILKKTVSEILGKNSDADDAMKICQAEELVDKTLAEYKQKAEHFTNDLDVNNSYKDAIKALNSSLRVTIKHVHSTMAHETKRLEKVREAEAAELQETTEKIQSVLAAAKDCVNTNISEVVTKMVRDLKQKVQKILDQLKKIAQELEKYIKELGQWISKAEAAVNSALGRVESILKEVNEKDSVTQPYKIKQALEQIKTAVTMLYGAGEDAKKFVGEKVKSALEAVKTMDGKLKEDLYNVKENIKRAIKALGTKLEKNVKDDLGVLESGIRNALTQHVKSVLKAINKEVDKIKNGEGLDGFVTHVTKDYVKKFKDQGFEGIVQKWIDDILKTNDILKGAIDSYASQPNGLGTSVFEFHTDKLASGTGGIKDSHTNDVAEAIKNKIKNGNYGIEMKFTEPRGDGGQNDKVNENIKAVYDCINNFHTKLGEKIKNNPSVRYGRDEFINGIVGAIEGVLVKTGMEFTNKGYLKEAVQIILHSVHATATQLAEQIKLLAGYEDSSSVYKIKKVDEAYTKATTLHRELEEAARESSGRSKGYVANQKIQLATYRHDKAVEVELKQNFPTNGALGQNNYTLGPSLMSQFHETHQKLQLGQIASATSSGGGEDVLEQQLKDDPANGTLTGQPENKKVTLQGTTSFTKYKLQVTQSTVTGDIDNLAGALPDKIKEIRTQVTEALKPIAQFHGFANEDIKKVTDNLTELYRVIKHEGEQSKSELQLLKNTYFKDHDFTVTRLVRDNIKRIKYDLEQLKTVDLGGAIKEAEYFLTGAEPTCKATIKSLEDHVKAQAADAEAKLTTHARKRYVNSIQTLLTAFSDKVEEELKPLPKEIADDLTLGFKGFMSKFEEHFITHPKSIRGIKDIENKFSQEKSPLSQAVVKLHGSFKKFFHDYQKHTDFSKDFRKFEASKDALQKMLAELITSQHFNQTFMENSESLENELSKLNPLIIGEAENPFIVDALKKGFSGLIEELGNTYISTYSEREINWQTIGQEEKEKYAKISLTLTPTVYEALTQLKEKLDDTSTGWKLNNIYNNSVPKSSLHALFFRDNGYDSALPVGAEHGELNHKPEYKGSRILTNLMNNKHNLFVTSNQSLSALRSGTEDIAVDFVEETGIIHRLRDYLNEYFDICHLTHIDKPRSPCSVFEMSLWLSGLPHNPIYEKLKQQITTMFEVPSETDPSQKIVKPMNAYPQQFTDGEIHSALEHVTSHAYSLLTGVVGHGDDETFYAWRDLCEVLGELVGADGVFTKLYAPLTCLLNRAPMTLPDVFAFYYSLALADKITATVGCDHSDAVSLLDPCKYMYESSSHFMHETNVDRDLSYFVGCGKQDCGYFMRPLNSVAYYCFAPKHADKYLSWILGCANQLVRFFEELKQAFCNISCVDSGCSPCLNSAACRGGKHGNKPCGCRSMVDCKGVSPTFYRFGLTFPDASNSSRKQCSQFCKALEDILKSGALSRFLKAIDEFMFTVRKNFIWTLLALWSLSLLYLLHITVVRLDVLRIRSHLRSPSSHRIAAQSLLAAARVKALASVKYFSP